MPSKKGGWHDTKWPRISVEHDFKPELGFISQKPSSSQSSTEKQHAIYQIVANVKSSFTCLSKNDVAVWCFEKCFGYLQLERHLRDMDIHN